jgi:hypothetical protein
MPASDRRFLGGDPRTRFESKSYRFMPFPAFAAVIARFRRAIQ